MTDHTPAILLIFIAIYSSKNESSSSNQRASEPLGSVGVVPVGIVEPASSCAPVLIFTTSNVGLIYFFFIIVFLLTYLITTFFPFTM